MPADDFVDKVFARTNQERNRAGLPPLTLNPLLTAAAEAHSQDMAQHHKMDHTGSDGSSPFDRMTRAGYKWSYAEENVASGPNTPEEAMDTWMKSPGHRANILNPKIQEIGIARSQANDGTYYWTQNFGTPADGSPHSTPTPPPSPGTPTPPPSSGTPTPPVPTFGYPYPGSTPGSNDKPKPPEEKPLTEEEKRSLAAKITDHASVLTFCLKTANEQFGDYCQTEKSLVSLAIALYTGAVSRG